MESFILRRYRKDGSSGKLVGTVEDAVRHKTLSFRSYEELLKTLNLVIMQHPDNKDRELDIDATPEN